MNSKKKDLLVLSVFIFLTLIVFRNYFFQGQIPFPANFLVSFFQPWVSQKFPGWEQGIPAKPHGIDVLKIFYPQRIFTNLMIKKGELPFWNPYNFSGNVHLANSQTAIFYPLFFLFYLPFADPIFVWSLLVVIQPILSAGFTYLFLKLINQDFLTSLYGALTFAFCGYMIVRWEDGLVIGHALIWLPFILWTLEKYLSDRKKRWLLLAIFGLINSLLTGWFQATFYVWLISALYWFFRIFSHLKENWLKKIGLFLAPFLTSLALSSFHLLPAVEAFSVSPRGLIKPEDFLDLFLAPWYHLITFLAPDFFGNPMVYNFFGKIFYQEAILYLGLIPLALALWALISRYRQEKNVQFFGLLGIITLLLGFDFPFTRWVLSLPLPVISSFLPSRIFFINSFCFSILAAFGFSLLKEKRKNTLVIILGFFALSFFLAGLYGLINWAQNTYSYREYFYWLIDKAIYHRIKLYSLFEAKVMLRNLVIPLVVFLAFVCFILLTSKKKKNWLLFCVFMLTILPQLYFANKFLYFSEKQYVFPSHPVFDFLKSQSGVDRFWSWGQSHILPNLATYYQIYSPEGVDAMYPLWYGELVEAVDKKGEIRMNVPRIEPRLKQVGDAAVDWEDPWRYRFLSLAGVKYIVGLRNEKFLPPTHSFQKIWEKDSWAVWEYKKALPRAFWVPDYVVAQEKQARADFLFNPDFPLEKKVVLNEPVQGNWHFQEEGEGKVEIISYQPNKVILQVEARQDGLVFLSDVYYPGWKVTVAGQPAKIYQANYAFRAVPVAQGKQEIIFSYFPDSFKIGVLISLISLLALACWLGYCKIGEKDAG